VAGCLGDEDLARARDSGLAENEIWDVGSIMALSAAPDRLAHLAALRPGEVFCLMGRVPR
jgi:hypothetical protein